MKNNKKYLPTAKAPTGDLSIYSIRKNACFVKFTKIRLAISVYVRFKAPGSNADKANHLC